MIYALLYAPAYQDSLAFGSNYTSPYQSSADIAAPAPEGEMRPAGDAPTAVSDHPCFYCAMQRLVAMVKSRLSELVARALGLGNSQNP